MSHITWNNIHCPPLIFLRSSWGFVYRQYEGSLKALHTMMVDPNGMIKKPGAKDLSVIRGEVLDIIQLTSTKKALCRNQYGKCMSFLIFTLTVSWCM